MWSIYWFLIGALRVNSKRSKKHLSKKQHKEQGTLDLPRKFDKFDNFRPMHEFWKGYRQQLLNAAGKNQLAQCLLDADLHGAMILGLRAVDFCHAYLFCIGLCSPSSISTSVRVVTSAKIPDILFPKDLDK
ncbi:ribonuclease MRP protein subunit POP4-like [Prosopis cineraria]|uniref:ribonuclease MRP protein subunit POP4-like n=1 Tax=Prosopis cineraria TaxID=364024 RepID=UPI00240F6DB1|nr:ribonuclease MRP protein subunit POP4-like [Prosopis cineraria]XP_054794253.1 ribonuclease MRP protein subunit POP4-like [Prosopis cineraria]XP_054794254.1 ribonuclease MRP protein subunit POP4-like [Prosopis cineraria]XP_054794255.1 ribonuclease MRP protein subunit POP4-like [Prosopis cineraria]XP_054794256.1 ribonuclease MRP protein subunit POP4-like [Prosopis cineraria]XP_054794257.1 ribonuclease MRP protein subunit POP4-like [Prosopis cineraria]